MQWRSLWSWLVGGREQRAVAEWGSSAIPTPLDGATSSFARVDLRTAEASLQKVAVWSATDLIASVASQLPLDTYLRRPDGTSAEVDSPLLVLDPGGEGHGSQDWIYQYLMSKLLRGNAYGQLAGFDRRAHPSQIVLYHPDDVQGWRDRVTGRPVWRVDGAAIEAEQMWHRRSYPLPGALLGLSPVRQHQLTIGQGIAAARFGAQWFSDGAHPSGILRNTEVELNKDTATAAKERFVATVYGTREPLAMGRGWEFQQIQVSAEESQFLETQRYTAAECARIFGPNVAEILGYETGGSMTYANVEQRSIDFLKFTLNRWLRDVEQVFTALLPRPQYVKFNRAALLETDLFTRYRAYATAIASRWLAPSEVRPIEDMAPLTDAQRQEIADVAALAGPSLNPIKETEK